MLPSFDHVMLGGGLPLAKQLSETWLPTRASSTGGGVSVKVGVAVEKKKRFFNMYWAKKTMEAHILLF